MFTSTQLNFGLPTLFNGDRNADLMKGWAEVSYDFSPGYSGFVRGSVNTDNYSHLDMRTFAGGVSRSESSKRATAQARAARVAAGGGTPRGALDCARGWRSSDGGATWRAASSGLPVYQPAGFRPYSAVIALVIDPQNPSTLYAAPGLRVAVGGGVYKSTDGAASWSPANSGIPDSVFIGSLAIDPQDPNTLYAGTQD